MAFKVKYIAGSGLQLAIPLSDGQANFVREYDDGAVAIYDIENVEDFLRIIKDGKFEAVEVDAKYFDPEKFKKGVLQRIVAARKGEKAPVPVPDDASVPKSKGKKKKDKE